MNDTPYVSDVGSGPALLMLHGIGGSADTFAPQTNALKDDLRLLAWDAPGYGRSADPESELGIDDYAEAAGQVIRDRCPAGAHVLGMSWGGVVATRLALRHPDLVRSLILGDSTVGSGAAERKASDMRQRVAQLGAEGAQEFARTRSARLLSDTASAELRERARTIMATSVRLPGYGYAAESMAVTDHTALLPTIDIPTLVLSGDEDRVTGHDLSQVLAGGIPGAVFVTLRGAGHLSNMERPEAFNAWVASFITITERLHD